MKKSNQKTFAPLRAVLETPGTKRKQVLLFRAIEKPKEGFYPQISQINADYGANTVCVNLRNLWINSCVDKAQEADVMKKSWMPAFAGMTGLGRSGGWPIFWGFQEIGVLLFLFTKRRAFFLLASYPSQASRRSSV